MSVQSCPEIAAPPSSPAVRHYPMVVIGGGSGGYAAARTYFAGTGQKVAIVDGAAELGGLCILRGCMPSKTLIYAAEVQHRAATASTLGLQITVAPPDTAAVQARKRRVIADFASYRQEQLASDRFDLYRAWAHFVEPDRLELSDGRQLTFDHCVVATGSVVAHPPVPGLAQIPYWTSDDVLAAATLPKSMIVLGGGVVACELAQYLQRMGVAVTLIQRSPHLLREFSTEAGDTVAEALRAEGMTVFTGTRIEAFAPLPEGHVGVRFVQHGEVHTVTAERLLNALGRMPATEALQPHHAGVTVQSTGHLATNRFQQTSNPRVYAVGDCAGPLEIVHVAIQQGEVAAKHALGQSPVPVDYDLALQVVFTDPQVAQVGPNPKTLAELGPHLRSASYPFNDHGKSLLMEAARGHVRVWTEAATGRLVAAECVGRDAGELIHPLAVGLALKATAADLLRAPWYHPTLSEIWTYPLEDLAS